MRTILTALLIATALAAPVSSYAQRQGALEVKNVAEREVTETGADGKTVTKRVPITAAVPGSQVIYTTTFRNSDKQPAADIAITNAIPANTTYVGGSASGDNTAIALSADGGKTWAPADKLTVRGADAQERPAAPADVTNLRWTYRGALAAGARASVAFRVTVN